MLPATVNIGQELRWAAAVEEIKSYFKVPAHFQSVAFREFSTFVTNCIGDRSNLRLLDQPCFGNGTDEEFPVLTVFRFCRCETATAEQRAAGPNSFLMYC
jgi:hypothetical protein